MYTSNKLVHSTSPLSKTNVSMDRSENGKTNPEKIVGK
jgi:hypothetical protein